MNFPFEFYGPKDGARLANEFVGVVSQSWIAYLPCFLWEDVKDHRAARERELLDSLTPSMNSKLREVLERRRQILANEPGALQIFQQLLYADLIVVYPDTLKYGFDLIVWFKPKNGLDLFGELVGQIDFFIRHGDGPDTGIGRTGGQQPDCRLTLPLNAEDVGVRVGVLDAGLPGEYFNQLQVLDADGTIPERRLKLVEDIHRHLRQQAPGRGNVALPVHNHGKHRFLNFACINALLWFSRQRGIPLPQALRISSEFKIAIGKKGPEVTPDPKLEVTPR